MKCIQSYKTGGTFRFPNAGAIKLVATGKFFFIPKKVWKSEKKSQ